MLLRRAPYNDSGLAPANRDEAAPLHAAGVNW